MNKPKIAEDYRATVAQYYNLGHTDRDYVTTRALELVAAWNETSVAEVSAAVELVNWNRLS